MEVNYRPQPDVSTVLDMTKKGGHSERSPERFGVARQQVTYLTLFRL
jgi:hypothetical protein